MPPKSLATIAVELMAATDVDAALRIVNEDLISDKYAGIILLGYDGRRGIITGQTAGKTPDLPPGAERPQVALDHLPVTVRYALLAGQRFADVGEQATQYARLLGVAPPTDDSRLFLKGIVLDGALTAVLGAYDARRRGISKILERIDPLAALFELAYARLFERDARFEAVTALHDITSRLRAEHAAAMAELERELRLLRTARGDVINLQRAQELEDAARIAQQRASTSEQQLAAVERQVSSAVQRLEQAHLQIFNQTETIQRLEDALSGRGRSG